MTYTKEQLDLILEKHKIWVAENAPTEKFKIFLKRYYVTSTGKIFSFMRDGRLSATPRQIAWAMSQNGYPHVILTNIGGKRINFKVHRIVAELFCPKPLGCNIVHHKNSDKTDNRASNLKWVTHKENTKEHFKAKKKVTQAEVVELSEYVDEFFSRR